MDNMAYLQQISGASSAPLSSNKKKKFEFNFSKIFNVWTAVIAGALIALLIIVGVVVSVLNRAPDMGDRDLMIQSYFTSSYMTEQIFDGSYLEDVKNSDIRNMSMSFAAVLKEVVQNDKEFLLNKYGVDVGEIDEEAIALSAKEGIDELAKKFNDAKLNGVLDRTWLREMTMQVAILRSYQSGILARVDDEEIVEFAGRIESNLDNIYNQFHDFKSVGI